MFTKELVDLKTMLLEMEDEANEKYEKVRQLEAEITKLDIVMERLRDVIDEMKKEVVVEPLDFE